MPAASRTLGCEVLVYHEVEDARAASECRKLFARNG
jgi:hypothetical protein